MRRYLRNTEKDDQAGDGGFGSLGALLGLPGGGASSARDAEERVATCLRILPFVLVAHLLACTIEAILMPDLVRNPSVVLGLGMTIAIDLAVFLGQTRAFAKAMRPAIVARILCGYGIAVGATWACAIMFGARLASLPTGNSPGVALVGAFVVATVALSTIPAAAIGHALIFIILVSLGASDFATAAIMIGAVALSAAVLLVRGAVRRALNRDRDRAERGLRQAGRLLAEFERSGKGWFWETDANGNLTYLSQPVAEQMGISGSVDGLPFTSLIVHETAGQDAAHRTIGFHLTARTAFSGIDVQAANHDDIWWSLSGAPSHDRKGRFIGFRGSGADLSESRRADADIHRLAHYDALTGLANRVLMRSTLQNALHREGRHRPGCALFMLDLDRFKSVNDTLGHPVGDALLQEVAKRLEHVIGTRGRVGRLGGDEFIVMLPNAGKREELGALADQVIVRLSYPYAIAGSTLSIGASVGIAISPFDGDCPDELARNADLALYAAKEAGKGVHRFYAPQMHDSAKDRRLLEMDLREALGRDELRLLYQPIVDVATEAVVGFEALLRWHHPTRGILSPTVFVPIAEEIGIIPQIGEWVLRTACHTAAEWPSSVRIAVNLSPLQVASAGLPALVDSALAASELQPSRLELELTESVFINESASIDATFVALKGIGVRMVLDDFGTGYASLANLKRLPFDKLKIDRSFVCGASLADGREAIFIRAIVQLAISLGMETTAEGAETIGEVDLIRSLGCTQVQGYILGKPMTAEDALAKARGSAAPPVQAERVREPRTAILRFAVLHSEGREYPIRIRNISKGGALIEIDPDARIGNIVEIALNDHDRFSAGVRWMKDRRLGVAFTAPVEVGKFARVASAEPLRDVEAEASPARRRA